MNQKQTLSDSSLIPHPSSLLKLCGQSLNFAAPTGRRISPGDDTDSRRHDGSEATAMRGITAGRSLGLLLACSAAAIAGDDGPPLSAPSDLPPPIEAAPAPDHQPVLVVPGLSPPRVA